MLNQIRILEYSNYPIPYLDIEKYLFNEELINAFTKEELIKYSFIPMEQYDKILTTCVCNPSIKLIKNLEKHTKQIIRIFWCEEWKLVKMIHDLKNNKIQFLKEEEQIQWKG